jgi:hypothetical protein
MNKHDQLLKLMQDLSERCYCVGWMNDTEAALWDAATKETAQEWGMSKITKREANRLYRLAKETNGWWIWNNDHGNTFIQLHAWRKHYEKHWERK